jgi:protein tyrosine/serine phosphatase
MGCAFIWTGLLRYSFFPKRFGVVERGRIYRSGQLSANLVKKILVKYKIRVVVDLSYKNSDDADQQAEEKVIAELGIEQIRIPMRGNGISDVNNFARAISVIYEADKKHLPVLVHCAAGAQRTGAVIALYRLLIQKRAPDFVEDELEYYGCDIDDKPNLFAYLNGNMGELAKLLKQSNIIKEVPSPLPQLPRD